MSSQVSTDAALRNFAIEVGDAAPTAVEGNRTRWNIGGTLSPQSRLIRAPQGIVEHVPAEMTARVRVGTNVADLHAELALAGQRTALPERGGTIGGALAVGENATEVLGRGLLRDAVLQLRYISAEGVVITVGGPVVKNVTGFNVPKLMVGSLGTLGLFAEVVLRTNPIPAVTQWFRGVTTDPTKVNDALLRPSCILWDGTDAWVQLEGIEADIAAEAAALSPVGDFEPVAGPPPLLPHRRSLTPAQAATFDEGKPFVASIGVGTVWASTPATPQQPDRASLEVAARLKAEFDPTGRLNPGRSVTATPGGL